ncbi:G-protein coupled receptor Mth2-like isoform X2 [Periplaneta americana]|uniref:G-protein coupled receptor Mth2-like isoform X2 n=1 Tax=Periplaneta americana TaxID=6978 RepID=UPI0037E769AB
MWLLALLMISPGAASNVSKCCDADQVLKLNPVLGELVCDESSVPLRAHGASLQASLGLRESCNASLIHVNQSGALPETSYCLDKVVSSDDEDVTTSIVGFVCRDELQNDNESFLIPPAVIEVKKCCVNGSYDPKYHICRETNDANEKLLDMLLGDKIFLVDMKFGLSECRANEAVVDIVVQAGDVGFHENGDIFVKTGSETWYLSNNTFCIDGVVNSSGVFVVKACQSASLVCRQRPCVQKCCRDGFGMIESKTCKISDFDFNPQFHTIVSTADGLRPIKTSVKSFAVLSNLQCDKYILVPESSDDDLSYLQADGRLYIPKHDDPHFPTDKYCLERVYFPDYDMDGMYAFVCFPEDAAVEESTIRFVLCSLGLITSSVFLLATFLVYACLPSLQNLHGKTLMCHVASLFSAYVCLSVAQLGGEDLELFVCVTVGYCILFTFLAAFSWLNIMCFDIWWTFGVIRSKRLGAGSRKQRECRRFAVYSLYAWGLPSVLTALTAAMDVLDLSPPTLKPDMGVHYCWFSKMTYGIAVYFFGPVVPMITCNVVLFVLTARSCSKVKAEIHRMQQNSIGERCNRRYQADKNKLIMNGKLFVVMGVTWTLEIVSSLVSEPPWIWYLSDAANALQGALIFGIFVLKRRVIRTLALRLGFHNLGTFARPTTTEHLTTCYDPYRVRKTSSISTVCTTDSRSARFILQDKPETIRLEDKVGCK